MRILYGTEQPFPHPRADTEQIVNTVAALSRRGVDVELLIPQLNGNAGVTADDLCRFYHVEGSFNVSQVPGTLERVHAAHKVEHSLRVSLDARARHADLVYTRSLGTVAACLARGYRVALDAYRPWPKQYPALRIPLRLLMGHKNFLGILLHSEYARDAYVDAGIAPDKLEVAHNGYEPSRFEPRLSRAEARAAVGLPVEGEMVVYAGKVNAKKGLDIVLEMARLRPEVTFVLVGSEGDGPIERAAASIDNVRIVERVDSVGLPPYLYAADVLIIPPSAEPLKRFGNTVLPIKLFIYLAAGRPILAPRAPDTAELLTDGENSVLVEPGNAAGAAAALRSLLDDDERRAAMERGAYETGQALTWDARAEKIDRFLQRRLAATR